MKADEPISGAIVAAAYDCPRKAFLLIANEPPADTFFSDLDLKIASAYRVRAAEVMSRLHSRTTDGQAISYVDCAELALALPKTTDVARTLGRESGSNIPVVFSADDTPGEREKLLVGFGALALTDGSGRPPDQGVIICGETPRARSLQTAELVKVAADRVAEIRQFCAQGSEPPARLNKHCATCDFQEYCRAIAITADDLSLMTGLAQTEIRRLNSKGVFTIAQLSYGYRPRRRRRIRPDSSKENVVPEPTPVRNDDRLRALAIKKAVTHVTGRPSFESDGRPVYIDVEGMPGRRTYYLIGIRWEAEGKWLERSFWADCPSDEKRMWNDFACHLRCIHDARLVSYGAYETQFLRTMKRRYADDPEDQEFIDTLISRSINLLAVIYGVIYFPTFSNGLKEIGRHLGFEWRWQQASGAAAVQMRRAWELIGDKSLKQRLVEYNLDDCRAAELVSRRINDLRDKANGDDEPITTESLEVGFQRTFGKFDHALPEFGKINGAAYWDYQRSRVFARTDKLVRAAVATAIRPPTPKATKIIKVGKPPESCKRCGGKTFWKMKRPPHIIYDLAISRSGVRRSILRQEYYLYRCASCRSEITTYNRPSRVGPGLRAFVVYLLIELRLSNQNVADHLRRLFGIHLTTSVIHDIKVDMACKYADIYRALLTDLASGALIHADETKGVVGGNGHYMWIFSNLSTVVYVYSETRQGDLLEEILRGFDGVLISDFYAAYDAVPCRQQKCLIHLMRDMNESLHKHPFDEELKFICGRFGDVLRTIVETIDRRGLKSRYLKKHSKDVEKFFEDIENMSCATEVSKALQKRIQKHKEKMFAFLEYDGVPWNNNNAEHAVRAFTRLRNAIGTSTPKGHREYAILLSIQQTLRYRNRDFLEFLRSGRGCSPDGRSKQSTTDEASLTAPMNG